eukprot:751566-Hanusia_phi.AAC.1
MREQEKRRQRAIFTCMAVDWTCCTVAMDCKSSGTSWIKQTSKKNLKSTHHHPHPQRQQQADLTR